MVNFSIDEHTAGLYYLWNRYYDPETSRFLSMDREVGAPAVPSTLNRYAYCVGNPVSWVDPTGTRHVAGGGGGSMTVDRSPTGQLRSQEMRATAEPATAALPGEFYTDWNFSRPSRTAGVIVNRRRTCSGAVNTEEIRPYSGVAWGVSKPMWGSASGMEGQGRTGAGVYAELTGGAGMGGSIGVNLLTGESYTQSGVTSPQVGGQVFVVSPFDFSVFPPRWAPW